MQRFLKIRIKILAQKYKNFAVDKTKQNHLILILLKLFLIVQIHFAPQDKPTQKFLVQALYIPVMALF